MEGRNVGREEGREGWKKEGRARTRTMRGRELDRD